jgi:hypothetical protein
MKLDIFQKYLASIDGHALDLVTSGVPLPPSANLRLQILQNKLRLLHMVDVSSVDPRAIPEVNPSSLEMRVGSRLHRTQRGGDPLSPDGVFADLTILEADIEAVIHQLSVLGPWPPR